MIHPTAIIHPGARLADDVQIGPYAIIGEHVSIGRGTSVGPHAVIEGWTDIGEENRIFQLSSVGAIPQDLKYRGEETRLRIGNRNTIREFATLHLGTVTGDGETTVGDGNLFMAYSHVAHDCHVGNGNVFANGATLAGHVTVQDNAILGGLCAVHQFARVGSYAMVGGGALVSHDVPPYTIAASGERRDARIRGLNLIGLKRRGFSDEAISTLKKAYRVLTSDLRLEEALQKIVDEVPQTPEVVTLVEFVRSSERGICR